MTTAELSANPTLKADHEGLPALLLSCWRCDSALAPIASNPTSEVQLCLTCNAKTEYKDGIWRSLSPHRVEHFRRFTTEYEFVREAEGRGAADSAYYLALPYNDLSGGNTEQWRIRARTFRYMEHHILNRLAARYARPLRILDLGAGNGWMTYRLALLGHQPVAVDLLTNDKDGLGAAINFNSRIQPLFPRVQAELRHLPFHSSSFDVAIFNASFHYSEDYEETFTEAFRCTRSGGAILIADTPWYASDESGRRMVEEKHARFTAMYGFPSNSIPSLEYLTPQRLESLQRSFNARWETFKPFYGINWTLRPLRAKLGRRRPPSRFHIYAAWVNR